MPRRYLQRQSIALLASLVALGAAGWDGSVSRSEGILLVAAFAAYLTAMLRSTPQIDERLPRPEMPVVRTWGQLAAGLLIVVVAAELIVVSAVTLAERWAVPQSFIAIVLIGAGTSIPEMSICIAAISRKKGTMAVGNIIGSNIFDTLLPVGIAGIIAPIGFSQDLLQGDLLMLMVITAAAVLMFLPEGILRRGKAAVLLVLYSVYVTFKFVQL